MVYAGSARLVGRAGRGVHQSESHPRQVPQRLVEGDEAAGKPGPGAGARSAGVGAGRAGGGSRSPARIELRELLKVLAEQGKAILVSSHILTELSEICNGAVIIEQGRLLRAGQMEHIISSDSLERTVVIRCQGSAEDLHRELIQTPLVREARVNGPAVEAVVSGGDEVCGELLRYLVLKQLRVVDFHQRQVDLEDVFMTVTKGQVQ